MAAVFGFLAFVLAVLLGFMVAFYFHMKAEVQTTEEEIRQVKHKAQVELARYQSIADLEKYKADLGEKLRTIRALLPKFQTLAEMEKHKSQSITTGRAGSMRKAPKRGRCHGLM